MGQSDLVVAMAKKKHDVMEKEREHLLTEHVKRCKEVANKVFDQMTDSQAMHSTRLMLHAMPLWHIRRHAGKTYYPVIFMACLNSYMGSPEKSPSI